jgi:hypothetical protein
VYIAAIVGVGFACSLIRGAGTFQMLGTLLSSKISLPFFTRNSPLKQDTIAVIHDHEAKDPNIFGPYGGNSRLSSLTEISFDIGLMVGPLLSGNFLEVLGYYYANIVLGELFYKYTVNGSNRTSCDVFTRCHFLVYLSHGGDLRARPRPRRPFDDHP